MKKAILFLYLASLAVLATGQEIDTSYTSLRWGLNPLTGDSVFFETLTERYADGRVNVSETIVGDTATVINYFANRAEQAGRAFARSANEVWKKPATVAFILQANAVLSALFDTTIIQVSVDRYGPAVDSTDWDITSTEQGNFTGQMTIAPSGNSLRMRIGATNYPLLPVGDAWIRFQNFPAGSFTDLHRKEGPGKLEFRSVDEKLIIRRQ